MRIQHGLAVTTAFALALVACGSPANEGEDPGSSAGEEVVTNEPVAEVVNAKSSDENDVEIARADGDNVTQAADSETAPMALATATPAPSLARTATPTQASSMEPPASFNTCVVCHSLKPGQNMVGPSLASVVGRKAGAVAGANYSPSMKSANITWTEANLSRFILDPNAVVPGSTMPSPGLDATQTQAVVNYLKTL